MSTDGRLCAWQPSPRPTKWEVGFAESCAAACRRQAASPAPLSTLNVGPSVLPPASASERPRLLDRASFLGPWRQDSNTRRYSLGTKWVSALHRSPPPLGGSHNPRRQHRGSTVGAEGVG